MNKPNEKVFSSDIYARVREARMSPAERAVAINALRNAELIGDAIISLTGKLKALGALFMKPSLRH